MRSRMKPGRARGFCMRWERAEPSSQLGLESLRIPEKVYPAARRIQAVMQIMCGIFQFGSGVFFEGEFFSGRDEGGEEEKEADVGEAGVDDEGVGGEEASEGEPEEEGAGASGATEGKGDGGGGGEDEPGGDEGGGGGVEKGVGPGAGKRAVAVAKDAIVAEEFDPVGDEGGEVPGEVEAKEDAEDTELLRAEVAGCLEEGGR